MNQGDARAALVAGAAARGESLAALSRLLRRNPAYLQQFVSRGSPRRLPEDDRRILADYLGIDEVSLGAPASLRSSPLTIRRFDVTASAGPGSTVEDEGVPSAVALDPGFLRLAGVRRSEALTLLRARGDSMAPTILDGSDLLVDTADRRVLVAAHVFVLRLDGAVLVKRVRRAGPMLRIESDNPAAPVIGDRTTAEVDVIGRVLWVGRRL